MVNVLKNQVALVFTEKISMCYWTCIKWCINAMKWSKVTPIDGIREALAKF